MAGPETETQASSQEQLMNAIRAKSLLELGMPVVPGLRYRKARIVDTQDIPTANDTDCTLFSTATSQSSLHALGVNGCSLREIGKVDDRTAGLVVAFRIRLRGFNAAALARHTDAWKVLDDGFLRSLTIDKIMRFENIPLIELAGNLGGTAGLAGGHTAFQMDGFTVGQPGFPDLGYVLEPYERFTVIGGQSIEAKIARNGGAGSTISAVISCRLELVTVTALPAQS